MRTAAVGHSVGAVILGDDVYQHHIKGNQIPELFGKLLVDLFNVQGRTEDPADLGDGGGLLLRFLALDVESGIG